MSSLPTRRHFLVAAATVTVIPFAPALATPESLAAAIKEVVGEVEVRSGRVKLDIPPLIENGNAVPLTVSVESPMTDADHVKAIHVFNEKNPQPHVFNAWLGPRNGRAVVGTRIKLADTQKVVAIAETSTGQFWSASADVIVTIAACVEDVK
ncbi:sulfur-oxidizing protein SoxY [Enhydrobacter aerosaccus]|uniref:Sulfur-oxidizing protein SoxY n=1 Tax=Enhydrobacter aerosaccus TaxID=225324 RepID=A0A1T4R5B1_9HYPH|nr:SoxY-related AACIE arm protein [Enhydrobacter aerosaccus]SKA11260.1 sulfur-oxidizing protein SoxY [Enhydrobacter aerosaccus]